MILDKASGVRLPNEFIGQRTNELRAVEEYAAGLGLLNRQAVAAEEAVRKQLDPRVEVASIFGNSPLFDGLDMRVLNCIFGWYAVTACNFVQTIGWLQREFDDTKAKPMDYRNEVLGPVAAWRDKVGAHPAAVCNSRWDNDAERVFSVIPQVSWERDGFKAAAMAVGVTRGGKSTTSDEGIKPWSVVETHAILACRFWPFARDP